MALIMFSATIFSKDSLFCYQESGNKRIEDIGRKTSEINLDTIFVPPPEFQSSPLDFETGIKGTESVATFSEPQKDLFQALTSNETSPLAQNASANGHFHDLTMNSPDLFKRSPAQTSDLSKTSQLKGSKLFKDEGVSLFQAAKGENLLHTERTAEVNLFDKSPSTLVDPFKSPSNEEDDLFRLPQNPFRTATTNEASLFQAVPTKSEENKQDLFEKDDLFGLSSEKNLDVFSLSSSYTVDPFPSPIVRDLFQDVSSLDDPFSPTPSKQYDPFQDVSNGTPDIFQPLPSKTNSKDTASVASYSTPLLSSLSEVKLDMFPSSPDLFKTTPCESQPAVQPKSSDGPLDIVLTTPQGTKHDILQPTPFTRARNLSVTPSHHSPAEMTHAPTFKRPPRPLPRARARPPRPEKPPKPEKPPTPANPIEAEPAVPKTSPKLAFRPLPLPKPVLHRKPKPPEGKPVNPENYVVFEDILLIGQERCVEDWPEDSPELNPDFKPSGTLRLRRESLKMKADSDGGSGEDQGGSGSHSKKKDKKFRMSLLSRRGSKDKFADDSKEARSRTLPTHKSSKEYFSDIHMSAEENEDGDQTWVDYKKKHLKTKVTQLLRRASTTSAMSERKHMNGHLPQESKDNDINKKGVSKKDSVRRWSEGTVLDDSTGEEEDGGDVQHGEKKKKKMKIKFVPHRGFAITVEKTDEPKGAHGYTPRKGSKEKSQDEVLGAHGYTPRKKSQDDAFEDVEELKAHSLQSTNKAAFMDDEHLQKTLLMSAGLNGDEASYGMEDCKPKKPTMTKPLHMGRRSSKEDMLDDTSPQKKKSSFSAEELDDDELNRIQKKAKHKAPVPLPRKAKSANGQSEPIGFSHYTPQQASSDAFAEDDITQPGIDSWSPGEIYDSEQDEVETCKPKKKLKGLKKIKAKSKATHLECEDPPGATSSDYLSEAAKAEWLAAQMDERAMAGSEYEDEEGDTDSLMEWWYTVEQWDEVPSDDEDKIIKEDASKSFTILADKVHRGLRVFNKVFTERAEVLWQSVITLHAIADDISNFHHKAKIAGITGGTTTAVGGVTAIAGLALAPFTFGASLVVTAVGVGVATAGGITSASAAISDNVNNMHDRKKVETELQEYEAHLLDIGKILHFVNDGLYKLRGHPFLRSGTQHYSEDWEIRRAVQMISLVDSPIMRAVEITDTAVASVQGLFQGMDKYFIKDSRELKKGCKKEVVCQIKEVANVLNDGIVELNAIREELQDATGNTVPRTDPQNDSSDPPETGKEPQGKPDSQPLHNDLSSSDGSLADNNNLPEKQNPGTFKGMMQKVNPFRSYTQMPDEADSAVPNTGSSFKTQENKGLHREHSTSSESLDDSTIERHTIWYTDVDTSCEVKSQPTEAPKRRTMTFRIKRILPTALFGSGTKDSATASSDTPLETVEVQTLEMAEVPVPSEGTVLDPLDDEDGLLAWWRTVEGWDEWNEANQNEEAEEVVEEAADRVFMAARLFVRFFNQRGASLQQRILELLALADSADVFHKKTVTASVGGGVASVAGSVTTITGLILAPFTAGTSLIVTAVGIGVATAGGLASASANITDTVHSKTDRKKVEKMIQDYQEEMEDIKNCLEFLQQGMETLEEWNFEQYAESISKKHLNQNVKHVMKEGGRAGKALVINTESLISTVQVLSVAGGAAKAVQVMSITTGVMSGLFLALDVFFLAKDSMELKKGAKTEFASKIREVCKDLQDGLLELNRIKEDLQRTMDGIEVEVEEEEEDEELLKSELKKLVALEE
ncbi:uncharacterized protein ABDE67_020523 [Symphorus nematophorus]